MRCPNEGFCGNLGALAGTKRSSGPPSRMDSASTWSKGKRSETKDSTIEG